MAFQWDPANARANLRKHGIDFADAVGVFDDPLAVTLADPQPSAGTMRRALTMRKEYDFSKGRRDAILPAPKGKTRITIRLDDDVLAWFRDRVHELGGGSYQTLINQALRRSMGGVAEPLETVVRRVVRQELGAARSLRPRRRKTRAVLTRS